MENIKSEFKIAFCYREKNGDIKCYDTKDINNKEHPLTISLRDEVIIFITDANGNILHEINKRQVKNPDVIAKNISIDYVNDNKLMFTTTNKNNTPLNTTYIKVNGKNIDKRDIYDHSKGGKLIGIEIPSSEDDVIILKRKDHDRLDTRLFSLERGKFISPSFTSLTPVKNTNNKILRFNDNIESSKEFGGLRYSTIIIGHITIDGVIYNEVYDEFTNNTRRIGAVPGRLIEGYKKFRNRLKDELNYRFEEDLKNNRKKERFEDISITQLKLKIKK